jgi:sec-independent protein translocase protein TatA
MAVFGLPGGYEWLIILVIALLIFGPTQLPKLAKMFGKSAKSLKDGIDGKLAEDEDDEAKPAESDNEKAATAAPDKDSKES